MDKLSDITTREQLQERGFKFIGYKSLKDGTEVWARFTGFEDSIQYTYFKKGINICGIQTATFSQLSLFKAMYEVLQEEFVRDIYYEGIDFTSWNRDR